MTHKKHRFAKTVAGALIRACHFETQSQALEPRTEGKLVVHPLKNILNKLRWDISENPEKYVITYRHRGAPGDVRQVMVSEIQKLGKSYFTLPSKSDEEVTIPFHRILEIRNTATGTVTWRSRKES